jgi:broad specificity phosphatase PhoE
VRVFFIRHGETAWSLSGQHTGRTEMPLTDRGEANARTLGNYLRRETFAGVWSSPRVRARRTCELAGLAATMQVERDLAEWDYGEYEGQRTPEIRATRPDWKIFRDGCPDGESPQQIAARADRVIARLRARDGDVALFSHGHFGRVFGARWIGLEVAHAEHLMLSTGSISILEWQADTSLTSISLWNATVRSLA